MSLLLAPARGQALVRLFCLLLFVWIASAEVAAQTVPSGDGGADASPELSDSDIEALLATLENDSERQKLIAQLRALLAARQGQAEGEETESPVAGFLREQASGLLAELGRIGESLRSIGTIPEGLNRLVADPGDSERLLRSLMEGGIALLALIAAGWLTGWAVRRLRQRLGVAGQGVSRLRRAGLVLLRLLLDLLPLLAVLAVYAIARVLAPLSAAGWIVATAGLVGLLASGFGRVLAHLLLAPRTPSLRLLPLSDARATSLYRWFMAIVRTLVWGYVVVEALYGLGLTATARAGLLTLVAAAACLVAILFVLRNRRQVRREIRAGADRHGAEPSAPRRWLAELWHLLALAAITFYFVLAAADFEAGSLYMAVGAVSSLVILLAAYLARHAVNRLERRIGAGKRWLKLLLALARGAIALLALVLLLEAWGASLLSLVGSEFGGRAAEAALSIGLLVLGAIALWHLSTRLLARTLRERIDAEGHSMQRSARLRTLLPLVRNAILIVLVTFVAMMALSELGVDIGPLLAGAGVIGLAIGFGAQTLVQDVITGLFIIVEDQVHVGDVVDTGGHSGVVEGITIRTLRLRDLAGTLHIVPFSQVQALQNLTRDFSYYVFNVGVAYREDVDVVIEELKVLGQELRADPEFGPLMLEDIEVLGLDEFADSAVIVKARIKTLPIKQWTVGREFNRRMKRRFDEKGIEIPFPHMTLYWGVDKEGRAPPAFVQLAGKPAAQAGAPVKKRKPPRQRSPAATSPQRGDDAAESSTGTDDD